jgi:peroxiredoxin family protein
MTDSRTEKKRSLSVICSKGSFDMAYPGLILANAARMAGVDARLFFTFFLHVLGARHRQQEEDRPPPFEPRGQPLRSDPGDDRRAARRRGIGHGADEKGNGATRNPAHALDMFKLTKDDLVPQVKEVLTAMDFMDMSEGAQIVFV